MQKWIREGEEKRPAQPLRSDLSCTSLFASERGLARHPVAAGCKAAFNLLFTSSFGSVNRFMWLEMCTFFERPSLDSTPQITRLFGPALGFESVYQASNMSWYMKDLTKIDPDLQKVSTYLTD